MPSPIWIVIQFGLDLLCAPAKVRPARESRHLSVFFEMIHSIKFVPGPGILGKIDLIYKFMLL